MKPKKRKYLNDYTILTREKEEARKSSIFIKSPECTKAWLATEDQNIWKTKAKKTIKRSNA
jgi:hypothetical protein